jgi:hypothetical protein
MYFQQDGTDVARESGGQAGMSRETVATLPADDRIQHEMPLAVGLRLRRHIDPYALEEGLGASPLQPGITQGAR